MSLYVAHENQLPEFFQKKMNNAVKEILRPLALNKYIVLCVFGSSELRMTKRLRDIAFRKGIDLSIKDAHTIAKELLMDAEKIRVDKG